MEQDSEVWDPGHGAKNTQIRWEACGGLECWLAPGGQGGTSSTTPPWVGGCIRSFPTPNPPSLKPSPKASKHKTTQEGKPALVAGIR